MPKRPDSRQPHNPDTQKIRQAFNPLRDKFKADLQRRLDILNRDGSIPKERHPDILSELSSETGVQLITAAARLGVQKRKLQKQIEVVNAISESASNLQRSSDLEKVRTRAKKIEAEIMKATADLNTNLQALSLIDPLKETLLATITTEKESTKRQSETLRQSIKKKEKSFEAHVESPDAVLDNPIQAPAELLKRLEALSERGPSEKNWLARPQQKKNLTYYGERLKKLATKRKQALRDLSQSTAQGNVEAEEKARKALDEVVADSALTMKALQKELRNYKKPPTVPQYLAHHKHLQEDPDAIKDPVKRARAKQLPPKDSKNPSVRMKAEKEKAIEIRKALYRQIDQCMNGSKARIDHRKQHLLSEERLPHENAYLKSKFPHPEGYSFEETISNIDSSIEAIKAETPLYDPDITRRLEATIQGHEATIKTKQAEIQSRKRTGWLNRSDQQAERIKTLRSEIKKEKRKLSQEKRKLKKHSKVKDDALRKKFLEGEVDRLSKLKNKLLKAQQLEKLSEEQHQNIVIASKNLHELIINTYEPEKVQDLTRLCFSQASITNILQIVDSKIGDKADNNPSFVRPDFMRAISHFRGSLRQGRVELAALGHASNQEYQRHKQVSSDIVERIAQLTSQETAEAIFANDDVQTFLRNAIPGGKFNTTIFNQLPVKDGYTQRKIAAVLVTYREDYAKSFITLDKHMPRESMNSPETDQEFFTASKQWFEHAKQYYPRCGARGQQLFKLVETTYRDISTPPQNTELSTLLTRANALTEYLIQKLGVPYPKLSEYLATSFGAEDILKARRQDIAAENTELNEDDAFQKFDASLSKFISDIASVPGSDVSELLQIKTLVTKQYFRENFQIEIAQGAKNDDGKIRGVERGDPDLKIQMMQTMLTVLENTYQAKIDDIDPTSEARRTFYELIQTMGLRNYYWPVHESENTFEEMDIIKARLKIEVVPLLATFESQMNSLDPADQAMARNMMNQASERISSIAYDDLTPMSQDEFDEELAPHLVNLQFFLYELGKDTEQTTLQEIIQKLFQILSVDDTAVKVRIDTRSNEAAPIEADPAAHETVFKDALTSFVKNIELDSNNPFESNLQDIINEPFDERFSTRKGDPLSEPLFRRQIIIDCIRYIEHQYGYAYNNDLYTGDGAAELEELAASLALSSFLDSYESSYVGFSEYDQQLLEYSETIEKQIPNATKKVYEVLDRFNIEAESIVHTEENFTQLVDKYKQELSNLILIVEKEERDAFKADLQKTIQDTLDKPADAKNNELELVGPAAEIASLVTMLDTAKQTATDALTLIFTNKIDVLTDSETIEDHRVEISKDLADIIRVFKNEVAKIIALNENRIQIKTQEEEQEKARLTEIADFKSFITNPTALTAEGVMPIINLGTDQATKLRQEKAQTLEALRNIDTSLPHADYLAAIASLRQTFQDSINNLYIEDKDQKEKAEQAKKEQQEKQEILPSEVLKRQKNLSRRLNSDLNKRIKGKGMKQKREPYKKVLEAFKDLHVDIGEKLKDESTRQSFAKAAVEAFVEATGVKRENIQNHPSYQTLTLYLDTLYVDINDVQA